MFTTLVIIIMLLAGCGDASTPVVKVATDPVPIDPTVVEAPCDLVAQTEQGTIYFYAEAPTASTVPQVSTCTEQDIAVLPAVCEGTSEYSLENGVARVLCGTFTRAGLTKTDFVRVEVGGGR
jgi:hypothetical protein